MWTSIIISYIQHVHAHKYFSEEVGNCCTPNCACFKWHLTCAYILDNSNHWSSYKWNGNAFHYDLARFSRIIVFLQKMVSGRLLHIISNSWRHFHKKRLFWNVYQILKSLFLCVTSPLSYSQFTPSFSIQLPVVQKL